MNKTIRRILLGVAVVVGGFLAIRLASILMAWSLYSWFFQTLRNSLGIQDTLNGAFSIWLTAITLLVIPTFLSVIFWKKDVKKVAIVVVVLSGWCVISYYMSQPQEGRFFNPMTGQPMYRYARTPDNRIDLFPLGYKYHPRYGTTLELVTPEVVAEMERKVADVETPKETPPIRPTIVTTPAPQTQEAFDPIIHVNRNSPPNFPDWVVEFAHKDLETSGPTAFDVRSLRFQTFVTENSHVTFQAIYNQVNDSGRLSDCLNLQDLEAIKSRGDIFFHRYFEGKAIFGLKSVVRDNNGILRMPIMMGDGKNGHVEIFWQFLHGGGPISNEFDVTCRT